MSKEQPDIVHHNLLTDHTASEVRGINLAVDIDPDTRAEALDLIGELMAHVTQKEYEYRHRWRHGDMVIWDNRSVIH